MSASTPHVTIEDTGSTNRSGLRVTVDREGHATVEPRNGETQHVNLPARLCRRFLEQVEVAAPLNEMPAVHCIKSVSFGSRTFLDFNGTRSPDISCPAADERIQTLAKDANEILQAAREAAGIGPGRIFTLPAPRAR